MEEAEKIKEKKKKIILPRGLTRRWLFSIIGVIFVVFIAAFIFASVSVRNYYYNSVESILNSGASISAVNYFSNDLDSGMSLESLATNFFDSYSYKDKTTLWVIGDDGNVVASSDGFITTDVEMPDYTNTYESEDGTGKYVGKNGSTGEKIMAVSRLIQNSDGGSVGAVRVMTSLEKVDTQITYIIILLFLVIMAVLAIIVLSNLVFIRSILVPIREITDTTNEISQGNMDVRIEKKYNDEIGNLCDSINSMAAEISSADKLKNEFISTISHELRTPLTSIKGWGETLQYDQDATRDEVTQRGLNVIVSEAGRLEGLVSELLDFSRLQSGRMTLHRTKIDIFAELDETVFTFQERAMREGIEVRYSIPEYPAVANADADKLKQVFMNILDNALKYSRAPGKIFVKAEFSNLDGTDAVKISVADRGCGISKEDLPHVKEKFYKANVSVRGSGIGLAVSNEIINLHNGRLEIDSEENQGTLVTIYLPINSKPSDQINLPESGQDNVSDEDMNIRK